MEGLIVDQQGKDEDELEQEEQEGDIQACLLIVWKMSLSLRKAKSAN